MLYSTSRLTQANFLKPAYATRDEDWPEVLATNLTSSFYNELTLKASAALHPLGRIGEPAEVASAIRWFLSHEQSWVTGQMLAVDAGLRGAE